MMPDSVENILNKRIMQNLSLSESDLEANRQGKLTSRQTIRLNGYFQNRVRIFLDKTTKEYLLSENTAIVKHEIERISLRQAYRLPNAYLRSKVKPDDPAIKSMRKDPGAPTTYDINHTLIRVGDIEVICLDPTISTTLEDGIVYCVYYVDNIEPKRFVSAEAV